MVVGIDVGGTKTLGVLMNSAGGVMAEVRRPTVAGAGPVIALLCDVVAELCSGLDAPPRGVGIGAAGLVDHAGCLRRAPNLSVADDFEIAALLSPELGLPVVVDNDANCAARAELHLGAARGVSDAVLVALGTGIGGAVIIGGEVRRGAAGMAGELGHMVLDPQGPLCPCGQRGCWERYGSGAGLAQLARLAAAEGRMASTVAEAGGIEMLRGEHVMDAVRRQDPDAMEVLDRFAWWVAAGMANVAALLDPELFVLGGGLVRDWDLFGADVIAHFAGLLVGADYRPVIRVEPATAGDRAGALGAGLLAIKRSSDPGSV